MIDKREGFTKKPTPSQGPYFDNAPAMPNPSNVQPSQKKAPRGPQTGAK